MDKFKLVSKYKPTGDQPQAIEALTDGAQIARRPMCSEQMPPAPAPMAKTQMMP